jgi:hypothetical protein
MFIVPVAGDVITTVDGDEFTVLSYTNLKDEPAVYVENHIGQGSDVVYLRDISELRGVRVELHKGSDVLRAYGPVKRRVHIPQPDDVITARVPDPNTKGRTVEAQMVVTGLKLHNRSVGLHMGLVVCDDTQCVPLDAIINIEGSKRFNRRVFLSAYSDYTPIQ